MPYSWILFDADNTLFDFTASERHSLQTAMTAEGIEFVAEHHVLYQRINLECWAEYEAGRMSKERLRHSRFERFLYDIGMRCDIEQFAAAYLECLADSDHLLEGARELLQLLHRHYRLGLVTNGLQDVQYPRLRRTGLTDFFDFIAVSDEIGSAKPHRAFFDHAFQQMQQPPTDSVLVVGDNLHADIGGALDYGAHACWYNPAALAPHLPIEPTYEIRHLRELPAILSV